MNNLPFTWDDSISIEGAKFSSDTLVGIMSSSCSYRLKIFDIPASILPMALATIASQKQVTMRNMSWRYSKLESEIEELRKLMLERSVIKANATADALGVSILGVFNHTERVVNPGEGPLVFGMRDTRDRNPKDKASSGIGFSLIHSGTLLLSMETEYRVSAMN